MLMAPLSHLMSVTGIAPIFAALVGLGVGVDYALFIVTRHRNGLKAGMSPERSAVPRSTRPAGRCSSPAARSVSRCSACSSWDSTSSPAGRRAVMVLFTVLTAITLLPAFLGVIGLKVLSRRERKADHRGRTARRARPACGHAGRVRVTAPRHARRRGARGDGRGVHPVSPSGWAPVTRATTRRRPPDQAYDMLAEGFGPGFNGPLLLVARPSPPADVPHSGSNRAHRRPGGGRGAGRAGSNRAGRDGRPSVPRSSPTTAPEDQATTALITLRRDVIPRHAGTTMRVYVAASPRPSRTSRGDGQAALFLAAIVGLGFLLLLLAFRSLVVPAPRR